MTVYVQFEGPACAPTWVLTFGPFECARTTRGGTASKIGGMGVVEFHASLAIRVGPNDGYVLAGWDEEEGWWYINPDVVEAVDLRWATCGTREATRFSKVIIHGGQPVCAPARKIEVPVVRSGFLRDPLAMYFWHETVPEAEQLETD